MDLQTIEHTLLFLSRAELRGNEVAAFVGVTNALHEMRQNLMSPSLPSAPAPRATRKKREEPGA